MFNQALVRIVLFDMCIFHRSISIYTRVPVSEYHDGAGLRHNAEAQAAVQHVLSRYVKLVDTQVVPVLNGRLTNLRIKIYPRWNLGRHSLAIVASWIMDQSSVCLVRLFVCACIYYINSNEKHWIQTAGLLPMSRYLQSCSQRS